MARTERTAGGTMTGDTMTRDRGVRPRGLLVISVSGRAPDQPFNAQVSMVDDLDALSRETVHATSHQMVLDLVSEWLYHIVGLEESPISDVPSPRVDGA